MHKDFFWLISRKPEYVKSVCIDRKDPFHFACRRWNFHNQPKQNIYKIFQIVLYVYNISKNL